MTQLTILTEAEAYIFRGRGVFIDVYKADDKIVTSGATSLADVDLRRRYRAIDSVATGRVPSVFCDMVLYVCCMQTTATILQPFYSSIVRFDNLKICSQRKKWR